MDYHALGLGEAASVVTAVTLNKDEHVISIACLYDPQEARRPYTLSFQECAQIVWDTFEDVADPRHVEAELIGVSLRTEGSQSVAVITTDLFELSFVYGSFCLQTSMATLPSTRT
jgi:hypothetical protein